MSDTPAREAWDAHIQGCADCVKGPDFCAEGVPLVQAAIDERELDGEIWSLTSTGPVLGEYAGAQVFTNVHTRKVCAPHPCTLHAPSDHSMKDWPILFRADRHLMERTCEHGIGHPDPDDVAHHNREGRTWQGVHGCDGCCRAPA